MLCDRPQAGISDEAAPGRGVSAVRGRHLERVRDCIVGYGARWLRGSGALGGLFLEFSLEVR